MKGQFKKDRWFKVYYRGVMIRTEWGYSEDELRHHLIKQRERFDKIVELF